MAVPERVLPARVAADELPVATTHHTLCDTLVSAVGLSLTSPPRRQGCHKAPALWNAETKLRHCTDWHKSWSQERGKPALQRRLEVHAGLVQRLLGDRPEGWLAKLEAHPLVLEQLLADGRHYNGREVTELLRAIRNVAEHWFQPRTPLEQVALV